MEPTREALLLASLGTVQGAFVALVGLCALFFGFWGTARVYAYVARRGRRKARWQAGQRLRLLIESREQCAALTQEIVVLRAEKAAGEHKVNRKEADLVKRTRERDEARAIAKASDAQLREALGIRAKLDEALKARNADVERLEKLLDRLDDELHWQRRMTPPASSQVDAPTLTEEISGPVDLEL